MAESLDLSINARRHFTVQRVDTSDAASVPAAAVARIERAFSQGQGAGLVHLAATEVTTALPPGLAFAREFAQRYVTRLCHLGDAEPDAPGVLVALPGEEELEALRLAAPPIRGLEYLDAALLSMAWRDIEDWLREAAAAGEESLRAYLHRRNPLWRLVGRVTFHLAENPRDESFPFAFLVTYAGGVSTQGAAQHLPLGRALKEYTGSANRARLASLLKPIREACERLEWVRELVDSGEIYQPLAWRPAEALRLLTDTAVLEACGLVVRIPDWWKAGRTLRPQVSVRVGEAPAAQLGAQAVLDFSVHMTLDGEALSAAEQQQLLTATGGLIRLRGRWVEADGEQLAAALEHWQHVEREVRRGGLSFHEGMRLLAGAPADRDRVEIPEALAAWSGVEPGEWLRKLLERLRHPEAEAALSGQGLNATLRPYQVIGAQWLALFTGLGLGACLADDMGLGKTVQVIALLVHVHRPAGRGGRSAPRAAQAADLPSLIVAPASLLANWKGELERFAPGLKVFVAHPSETDIELNNAAALGTALGASDVVLSTYGVLTRCKPLRTRAWRLAVLDEAQAIKNPGAQQTRAVKQLQAAARIALTGTPIENRLSDLWSLFDFLNPGLLGSARAFTEAAKRMSRGGEGAYAPLRRLVQPYILRRLKSDKRVIADLPEKTEIRAFCGLTGEQATLYQRCVGELARTLEQTDGIRRRGAVLSALMQLKQICNHPAHWAGQGAYTAARSGKFERLGAICEELAERQERVLVFTQFRELTEPLAQYLREVFGRAGLVLHGGTAVAKRQGLIEQFQREDGPPFFVLSLKAGGTGLNLTAASQVIHFDRWWNPAVENQATDRAFRIGQQRNVLVHKFICRGTVEEKIDALIEAKRGLAEELLAEGGERLLTEMSDAELLATVALDIHKACET
ncbi:MAG: DEAD/DEAH box helicase [Steroidobacteraceae bacterium]